MHARSVMATSVEDEPTCVMPHSELLRLLSLTTPIPHPRLRRSAGAPASPPLTPILRGLLDDGLHSDDFVDEEPVSVVVSIEELRRLAIDQPKARAARPSPKVQAAPKVQVIPRAPRIQVPKLQAAPPVPKVQATPPLLATAGVALRARVATVLVMLAIALCACVMFGMLMLSA
jgi:hypothetical protein